MQSVTLNRQELLDVLKDNREEHMKDYQEAMIEYRKQAILELTEALKVAKGKNTNIVRGIKAPEPQSFVGSYDTAIRMLEMSVDEDITLTYQEFQQYVEDKWQWKSVFNSTTTIYNAKKAA